MTALRLRNRLLGHFVVFSLLCWGSIVALSWRTHREQTEGAELLSRFRELEDALAQNVSLAKDFLLLDAQRVDFYQTRRSAVLDHKRVSDMDVERILSSMLANAPDLVEADSVALRSIQAHHTAHTRLFDRIVDRLLVRGMEDHGREGLMRQSAHALESCNALHQVDVLALRRLEKDYIIRHQDKYVAKLNKRIGELLAGLVRDNTMPNGAIDSASHLLTAYLEAFNGIVELDREVGLRDQTGLYAQAQLLSEASQKEVSTLLATNRERLAQAERGLINAYIWSASTVLLLSIAFAFLLSHRIAGPIKALAGRVHGFVQGGFRTWPAELGGAKGDIEVVELAGHFALLGQEIQGHLHHLNDKVAARTHELDVALERVQQKNDEITASLKYARSLQQSMLSSSHNLADLLPESFLLNIPRDIVGGDFIWTCTQGTGAERRVYFAVADCTGHGVPACLLSVMCHNALNDAMADLVDPLPSAVLERVSGRFAYLLGGTHDPATSDGMSISLCCFDPMTNTLSFSGSFQSIYVLQGGRMERIKGDRAFIGGDRNTRPQAGFTDRHVQVMEDMTVYLFSDGFADQFGGAAGRKLTSAGFQEVLAHTGQAPIAHQHRLLHEAFTSWKGAQEQVDDVMVLGIRLGKAARAAGSGRVAA